MRRRPPSTGNVQTSRGKAAAWWSATSREPSRVQRIRSRTPAPRVTTRRRPERTPASVGAAAERRAVDAAAALGRFDPGDLRRFRSLFGRRKRTKPRFGKIPRDGEQGIGGTGAPRIPVVNRREDSFGTRTPDTRPRPRDRRFPGGREPRTPPRCRRVSIPARRGRAPARRKPGSVGGAGRDPPCSPPPGPGFVHPGRRRRRPAVGRPATTPADPRPRDGGSSVRARLLPPERATGRSPGPVRRLRSDVPETRSALRRAQRQVRGRGVRDRPTVSVRRRAKGGTGARTPAPGLAGAGRKRRPPTGRPPGSAERSPSGDRLSALPAPPPLLPGRAGSFGPPLPPALRGGRLPKRRNPAPWEPQRGIEGETLVRFEHPVGVGGLGSRGCRNQDRDSCAESEYAGPHSGSLGKGTSFFGIGGGRAAPRQARDPPPLGGSLFRGSR